MTINPDLRCDLCGERCDLAAAYWNRGSAAFEGPAGYACVTCKPSAFTIFGIAL